MIKFNVISVKKRKSKPRGKPILEGKKLTRGKFFGIETSKQSSIIFDPRLIL